MNKPYSLRATCHGNSLDRASVPPTILFGLTSLTPHWLSPVLSKLYFNYSMQNAKICSYLVLDEEQAGVGLPAWRPSGMQNIPINYNIFSLCIFGTLILQYATSLFSLIFKKYCMTLESVEYSDTPILKSFLIDIFVEIRLHWVL